MIAVVAAAVGGTLAAVLVLVVLERRRWRFWATYRATRPTSASVVHVHRRIDQPSEVFTAHARRLARELGAVRVDVRHHVVAGELEEVEVRVWRSMVKATTVTAPTFERARAILLASEEELGEVAA